MDNELKQEVYLAMMAFQFDFKKIVQLSNDVHDYAMGHCDEVRIKRMRSDYADIPLVSILLMMQQVVEDGGQYEEIPLFLEEIVCLDEHALYFDYTLKHPIHMMLDENMQFDILVRQIDMFMDKLDDGWSLEDINVMEDYMFRIGNLYNHYHVKEKLFFPLIEQYGHVMMTRIIWRDDDRIRGLYHGAKNMLERYGIAANNDIRLTWNRFKHAFRNMIFQEGKFLFPIASILFKEKEWQRIAIESSAYGYEMEDDEGKDLPFTNPAWLNEDIPFGGGLLTIEEANLILNNLPLEITFVDHRSVFKYFNKIVEASEMMLIRTSLSIGRNVANCHPPKSLQKVMTLVRDLQTGKRQTEEMWFKMKGAYVHITYKALFNDDGEFMGILEYVQDIGPFFNLPKEVKRELSRLPE